MYTKRICICGFPSRFDIHVELSLLTFCSLFLCSFPLLFIACQSFNLPVAKLISLSPCVFVHRSATLCHSFCVVASAFNHIKPSYAASQDGVRPTKPYPPYLGSVKQVRAEQIIQTRSSRVAPVYIRISATFKPGTMRIKQLT